MTPEYVPTDEGSDNVSRTPEENERIVRDGFIAKAKKTLGVIPFSEEAVAAYYCAMDPSTPKRVKITLMGALAYFVMPIDLLPDFIAVLGFTDDAAVFWMAWRAVRGNVSTEHLEKAKMFLGKDPGN